MSELIVQPVIIENLRKHPNADKLEISDVLGWQLCLATGKHQEGDEVVYFPPDTLIPQELATRLGIATYLNEVKRYPGMLRTRAINLRGEPSYGVTVPVPRYVQWHLGQNVAGYYGAQKYEPPVRQTASDAERSDPLFVIYTDIENLRNHPNTFDEFPDAEVVITEKLHGSNVRVGMVEGVTMAGSHRVRRRRPVNEDGTDNWEEAKVNPYWFPATIEGVNDCINDLGPQHKQFIIFGEVFGEHIQSLHYGYRQGQLGFRAFDIFIDGKYADYEVFKDICKSYVIPMVPELYVGPFSMETVKELSVGNTTLGADHIREGVIIRPTQERFNRYGRVIMKYLGDQYLLDKNKTDYTDV